MRPFPRVRLIWTATCAAAVVAAAPTLGCARSAAPGATPGTTPRTAPARPVVGPVSQLSTACPPGSAEVETASQPAGGFVYSAWIGCHEIGFARSADSGRTWSHDIVLPGSHRSWDPALALGPAGTVYAAFMVRDSHGFYPVVDISTDHGMTFRVSRLGAPNPADFGDREFIAVGPGGQIYVTWDYAPNGRAVKIACYVGGSCAYTAGDLNEVIQRSTDGGRTWSKPTPLAPGFPDSGSISGPVIVRPSGRLDVLYERYQISRNGLRLGQGANYFTSSANDGRTWSAPVRLGLASATLSPRTWWIDGSIDADSAGNLYATWDTQSGGRDRGWLSYSATGGRTWSRPLQVTAGRDGAANILQVLGGTADGAYVGVLTNSQPGGYVLYVREFALGRGWITAPVRVSAKDGNPGAWPGDTFGLARLAGGGPGTHQVVVNWGSTVGGGPSEIWSAIVSKLP